jgi:hypothetical protein
MNTIIKQELAKYIKATDKVVEVETTTTNHYCLNYRFEVTREEKKYFIAIKEVNVMGQIKKHHTRLEVDTNLEIIKKEVDTEKIIKEIEVLKDWFARHKKFKGSRIWISQEKKLNSLQRKL